MVNNGFGAERLVASLLALTSFGSYNKRACGSLCSPKPLRAPHTRNPLAEIPHATRNGRKFKLINMAKEISENKKLIAKNSEKLNSIQKSIDKFEEEYRKQITEIYEKLTSFKYTGNPISPEEKKKLIEKFRDGTISKEEAEKLKKILEEEKREAEAAGNLLAAIAIGLLLAALAYFLYKLMMEE